jgi:D-arabinose 1-dehydrogenase-like Zn-dependent alcohol dehydrogenase
MDWSMAAVLSNIELRGTTMGSRKEFKDLVDFVREKRIEPVVSRVVKGIENLKGIDELFEEMRDGKQFGKLVVEVKGEEKEKL